jgi:MFS family permease
MSVRRYLLVRVLLNMTSLAEPFYPIFALDILGAPASMVGIYLSVMTFAGVLSNLAWQKADGVRATYSLLRTASFLTALTPLLAATLPWLMRLVGFTVERRGLLPAYLFAGVFLLAGSSESGRAIGTMALLLDISPDEERASYIGLVNTALGFVSFLPILSGAIIDRVGFEPIFLTATGLLLLGYLVTRGWKLGR